MSPHDYVLPDPGAIDLQQLQMMTSGDAALAGEVVGVFRSQADAWEWLLDPRLDPQSWGDAAHTIKGAARAIGAHALADAAAAAEAHARSGVATPVSASVALSAVRDRLTEALEAAAHLEHQLVMGKGRELGFAA